MIGDKNTLLKRTVRKPGRLVNQLFSMIGCHARRNGTLKVSRGDRITVSVKRKKDTADKTEYIGNFQNMEG